MTLALLILSLLTTGQVTAPAPTAAAATTLTVPAGTIIPINVTSTISTREAQSGGKFNFVVAKDTTVDGTIVIARCALGTGTVVFSGKHGINGHEGNLHLRFDTVTAVDGAAIALNSTEQQFNGKQRKAEAFMVSRWVNGDDVEVQPSQALQVASATDSVVNVSAAAPGPSICPAPPVTPAPTDITPVTSPTP